MVSSTFRFPLFRCLWTVTERLQTMGRDIFSESHDRQLHGFPKCICKCIFAKCTRLTHLLSFASLFNQVFPPPSFVTFHPGSTYIHVILIQNMKGQQKGKKMQTTVFDQLFNFRKYTFCYVYFQIFLQLSFSWAFDWAPNLAGIMHLPSVHELV